MVFHDFRGFPSIIQAGVSSCSQSDYPSRIGVVTFSHGLKYRVMRVLKRGMQVSHLRLSLLELPFELFELLTGFLLLTFMF